MMAVLALDKLGGITIGNQRNEIEADVGACAFPLIRAWDMAERTSERALLKRFGAVARSKNENHRESSEVVTIIACLTCGIVR